jgi:GH15 family glucan-1,4-alpha-glucosidase
MAGRYTPIGEYGVIGDLHTVALVGMDGSIDFLCLPYFDSPSVFAALVDAERGGRLQIALLLGSAARKQLYLPDTNVPGLRRADVPTRRLQLSTAALRRPRRAPGRPRRGR